MQLGTHTSRRMELSPRQSTLWDGPILPHLRLGVPRGSALLYLCMLHGETVCGMVNASPNNGCTKDGRLSRLPSLLVVSTQSLRFTGFRANVQTLDGSY